MMIHIVRIVELMLGWKVTTAEPRRHRVARVEVEHDVRVAGTRACR